jgi:hypothetical protein
VPRGIEISDAEQLDPGRQQLLLRRQQGGQLDIARVQLDLDDRLLEKLKPDEAKIFDGVGYAVIIGRGIAQQRQKFLAVRKYPAAIGSDQHLQPFHRILLTRPSVLLGARYPGLGK